MPNDLIIFDIFAQLLAYPDSNSRSLVEQLWLAVPDEQVALLKNYYDFVKQAELTEIEELFTATFDMNPATCLEVGWHLYGEEYQRGEFLVMMRRALAEQGIAETIELPDHLSHCLRLLAVWPQDESQAFVSDYLQPVLRKITAELTPENPFRSLLATLQAELTRKFGDAGKRLIDKNERELIPSGR